MLHGWKGHIFSRVDVPTLRIPMHFAAHFQDIQAATAPAPEVQRTPFLERRRRGVKGDAAALRPLLGKASALLGSVRCGGSLAPTVSSTLLKAWSLPDLEPYMCLRQSPLSTTLSMIMKLGPQLYPPVRSVPRCSLTVRTPSAGRHIRVPDALDAILLF